MHRRAFVSGVCLTGAVGVIAIAPREATAAGVAGAGQQGPLAYQTIAALNAYDYSYDNLLGTSLDLKVFASNSMQAMQCEQQVLAEIQRLSSLLSIYDPQSQISQLMRGQTEQRSSELAAILDAYEFWAEQTNGALNSNLGEVIRVWKRAEVEQILPTRQQLRDAANSPRSWNIDALGKGFIVDRAVEVASQIAPAGVLCIGGDIRCWGDLQSWSIGVADPHQPFDNAAPLTQLALKSGAVATSGDYARYRWIEGQRYSHLIDPRTLWPVKRMSSATVAAPDCMTANALSTAVSVLGLDLGQALLKNLGITTYLLADDTGEIRTGSGAQAPPAPPVAAASETAPANWPKEFQVAIDVELKGPATDGGARGRGGFKRPYVAVWVEDAHKKVVRTVAVWGSQPRWVPELSYWWNANGTAKLDLSRITRATRPAGKYTLAWDGKDEGGKPLPTGEYTIVVEINREHGRHVRESALVTCQQSETSAVLKQTAESAESKISYGPRAISP